MNQPTLDPQAQALLDQIAAETAKQPPPPPGADLFAAGRAAYRATVPLAGKPVELAAVTDRDIPGPDGHPLALRIYTPRISPVPLPGLVFLHGGGFTAGDLDTHDAPLRALALAADRVVVAVAYRLAPEHPFPAAPEDAYAATAWVAAHAGELGLDPGQLAVGGDSAGGALAAAVTLMARSQGGPRLAFQLLLYPDTDVRESIFADYPSWTENDGRILNQQGKRRDLDAYLPAGTDRSDPRASPLCTPDLAGLPPALVVTAGGDPQRDEGEAYAHQLQAAAVPVTLTRYPGMIHGFFQMAGALRAGEQLGAECAAALRKSALIPPPNPVK